MSSRSKRIKERERKNSLSSSTTTTNAAQASQLPATVVIDLQNALDGALPDGCLHFSARRIKESAMMELCSWIPMIEGKIKILELGYNEITSQGASLLFNTLRASFSSIRELDLSYNKDIDDNSIQSLGEYLKSNTIIEMLNLSATNVSDRGIELLLPYLDGNVTFRRLILDSCRRITDASLPCMMKIIESTHIVDVKLYLAAINQANALIVPLVSNVLQYGSPILDMGNRDIDDDLIIKICNGIKRYGCGKMQQVFTSLGGNRITSTGASFLFNTLKECKSGIIDFHINDNQLDRDCMMSLREWIENNDCLEILGLANNKMIGDRDIDVLADGIIGNTTLKTLDLSGNLLITDASVSRLIEIAHGSNIKELYLSTTSVSPDAIQEINSFTQVPEDQREIPIKSSSKSASKSLGTSKQ